MWPTWKGALAYGNAVVTKSLRVPLRRTMGEGDFSLHFNDVRQ